MLAVLEFGLGCRYQNWVFSWTFSLALILVVGLRWSSGVCGGLKCIRMWCGVWWFIIFVDHQSWDRIVSPFTPAVQQGVFVGLIDQEGLPNLPVKAGLPGLVKLVFKGWGLVRMYVQLVLDNSIGLIVVPEGIFMFPLPVPPCSVCLSPVYGFFSILLAGLAANSVGAVSLEAAARFALAVFAIGAGTGLILPWCLI